MSPTGVAGGVRRLPLTSGCRVLLACYTLFTVAAGARSAYQLADHADRAPVAYALSAVAAVVYLAATLLLRARHPAVVAVCVLELAGVLAVGTVSLTVPAAFADTTVWSGYGIGYGFVPLVLPVAGLVWVRKATGRGPRAGGRRRRDRSTVAA